MAKIKEYINYKRIETPVHGGVRIFYQHKLTNEIFCDGFHMRDRGMRGTREGERIFKFIDPNIDNCIKFVSNEKS